MGHYDYIQGINIASKGYPFYALIQAAMRQADSANLAMLKSCWPEVWRELKLRYNAPGGYLPEEHSEAPEDQEA
jgi:hypothetical protein